MNQVMNCILTLVLSVLIGGVVYADDSLLHLSELADANNWTVEGGDTASLRSLDDGFVELSFNPGTDVRLMLKHPKPIPANVTDVTFLATNDGNVYTTVNLQVLIKDSTGAEFAYYTDSEILKTKNGSYGLNYKGHRATEVRHRTRGMVFPAMNRMIRPLTGYKSPVAPLTWIGILVENQGQNKDKKRPTLYLRDFSVSTISPANTKLYYQFNDQECFGEVDGLPHLTFGQYWWWDAHYRVVWAIRDRFDGQPFMTGHAEIHAQDTEQAPHATQIARHIEIPVTEKGTYWVQVRVQRTDNGRHFKYYNRFDDYDYRLDVFEGEPAISTRVNAPRDPMQFVRIAPDRKSLTYRDGETFVVPVELTLPQSDQFNPSQMTAKIIVRGYGSGEQVLSQDIKPQWDENGSCIFNIDLKDQPAAAYRMQVQLLEPNGQVFDAAYRVVSKVEPQSEQLKPIPDSVPSAKQLLASDKPMFHLDATYESEPWIENPEIAWEKGFKPFLEEAGNVSKFVEYTIHWRLVEPIPGVFDWASVDKFVDAAYEKGLTVQLNLNFNSGGVPEWIPGDFDRTSDGYVFGHNMYLFHGMRPNMFGSPRLWKAINDFQMAAITHYRSHPGVHGYYYLAEHPGDAPWNGFIGGYSQQTLNGFVTYLKDQYKTLDTMNKACLTNFTKWEDIYPPKVQPDGALKADRTIPYRLVWLEYKDDLIQSARRNFVINARKIDPKRLLTIYATDRDPSWYVNQGCMTANGGTHDNHMPGYLRIAQAGFQMRNEEITPRAWSANSPYQLDRSFFHAAIAGPTHAHCKMFIASGIPFKDRMGPPYSIGRYIQFQSLWEILRQTEPVKAKVLSLASQADASLHSNSVGTGVTLGGWVNLNYYAGHTEVAMGLDDQWENAQVLLADGECIEFMKRQMFDKVVRYVKDGGTLVMRADAGRVCVDQPEQDWALLTALGIRTPHSPVRKGYRVASVTDQVAWGMKPGDSVKLRNTWDVPATAAIQTLASYPDNKSPAITVETVGKGRVVVIWGSTVVPEIEGGINTIHGKLMDWLGIKRQSDSDSPRLWTHFLKHAKKPIWYGLVYAGPTYRAPDTKPVGGKVWWPGLPESGTFKITELITGKSLGTLSASQLRSEGLPIQLEYQQVDFLSFEQQ